MPSFPETPCSNDDKSETTKEWDDWIFDCSDGGLRRKKQGDIENHMAQEDTSGKPEDIDDIEEWNIASEII